MSDSKKTLLLHIGITKTGSSYLQSCAALNQPLLLDHGIDYPPLGVDEAFFANARKGIVSGGNGQLLIQHITNDDEEELQGLLKNAFLRISQSNNVSSTLVSNEGLCNNVFAHIRRLRLLQECSRKAGYTSFKCLLIVRNPYEHMVSWYLEGLKGTGWAAFTPIDEYAEKYNDLPAIANAISNMSELNIELHCYNYTYSRKKLLPLFLQWAGISDPDSICSAAIPPKPVNRSLDSVEQIICQALAEHGIKPAFFASRLLNSELASSCLESRKSTDSIPFVSCEALDAMKKKNHTSVEFINRHLPEGQTLSFDKSYFPSQPVENLAITREQLRSVVSTFTYLLDQYTTSKSWKIDRKN